MSDRSIATVSISVAAVAGAALVGGLAWLADLVRAAVAVFSVFGGGVL
ncbi:hypothetical protein [Microbacterium sp. BDGP8]|nr:hypothetical protein [Microbacterium sp. BDGP8]WHE35141.1 hypothetical protein P6897_10580 [Microbacterium sp. BDGP8]